MREGRGEVHKENLTGSDFCRLDQLKRWGKEKKAKRTGG